MQTQQHFNNFCVILYHLHLFNSAWDDDCGEKSFLLSDKIFHLPLVVTLDELS